MIRSRTLEPGDLICEPGVYDLSLDRYHQQPCAGPSISSSHLRRIEGESPAHYWAHSPLNPNRVPEGDAEHFILGRAAHLLLLEGDEGEFERRFVLRPEELAGSKWQGNRTVCRDWLAAAEMAGKAVITSAQMDAIRGVRDSLASHPVVKDGLLNGAVEKTLAWQDAETGIWLLARPDVIPTDSNVLADLKVQADAGPVAARRALADHGYHMQLALAEMGMKAVLGRDVELSVLVMVEKTPPFAVNVKPLDQEATYFGARQVRRALRKFTECLKTGVWPGYDDDGISAHLPKFYLDQLHREADAGLLPELVTP